MHLHDPIWDGSSVRLYISAETTECEKVKFELVPDSIVLIEFIE